MRSFQANSHQVNDCLWPSASDLVMPGSPLSSFTVAARIFLRLPKCLIMHAVFRLGPTPGTSSSTARIVAIVRARCFR
jgi:hypothetical protein